MQTYLLDTLNRLRYFSEELDAKAILCNKSWWLFNDNGEKSLYIFMDNGDFFVTTNGVGLKGRWNYVPANASVILDFQNQISMYHPVFLDDNILALNLDGTQSYSFFIDERSCDGFCPKTLADLNDYFESKTVIAEPEPYNPEYEAFIKVEDEYWAVIAKCRASNTILTPCVLCTAFSAVLAVGTYICNALGVSFIFTLLSLFCFIYAIVADNSVEVQRQNVKNWIAKNPDNPVCDFLCRYYLSNHFPPTHP